MHKSKNQSNHPLSEKCPECSQSYPQFLCKTLTKIPKLTEIAYLFCTFLWNWKRIFCFDQNLCSEFFMFNFNHLNKCKKLVHKLIHSLCAKLWTSCPENTKYSINFLVEIKTSVSIFDFGCCLKIKRTLGFVTNQGLKNSFHRYPHDCSQKLCKTILNCGFHLFIIVKWLIGIA